MKALRWSEIEFADAVLPDERFRANLAYVTWRLERHLGLSFSAAAGHAGRQAVGRYQRRSETTVEDTMAGHYAMTAQRSQGYPMVLVAQDTTVDGYGSHAAKEGFGFVDTRGRTKGLLAHTALVMSTSGLPLGVLDLTFWTRDPSRRGQKHERAKRPPEEKESWRWPATLQRVQERLPEGLPALFIQDREGDYYGFFSAPRREGVNLLVRVAQNRLVTVVGEAEEADGAAERERLFEVAERAPEVGRTTVKVWRQRDRKGRLKRTERLAEVRVCAQEVDLQPPKSANAGAQPVRAWLVRSVELDPPAGEEAVEWVLLTTMPLQDGRAAAQLVRWYALRWMVERLHYVLKSGCGIERLQIVKREELEKVLALYWVVAWRVLWVTHLAREEPDWPAAEVLGSEALRVLSVAVRKPVATARDVTHALAKLAGAETWKNAPEPGVKRLWMGLRALDDMVAYDRALREHDAKQG